MSEPPELPKTFDPTEIEARWYAYWEANGLFRPDRPDAEPWTIVNPPPNVTGKLHIGHALDNTLQDILVRRERMRGKDALWVVGTDHAGIATQMVVERQLNDKQQKRTDFSREDFIAKVWEWKEESGGEITRQLRRLGCSMDWENERFTMDEGFSEAVTKVFVDLYNEGLIYRDKRLVNWDPGLKTAISDLEVENVEVQGHFWHFRYPLEDGSGAISVATTRPETMLADMAVAVHPSDERYTDIVGKQVRLPITGRLIPVIADEHADPELGSGAVKITPGHDFNDFEVGKRAGIAPAAMLNMLDAEAKVVQTADGLVPDQLLGLDRFEARKQGVALIEAEGALESVEERTIVTPYGDRSNVVIEPWLTDQWYVDAEKLAQRPIEAIRHGDIDIVPKSWEKTFFNWMENIQPWCVSRQLWWGHRIPAWFGPGNDSSSGIVIDARDNREPEIVRQKIFVAVDEEDLLAQAREFYGADREFVLTDEPSLVGKPRIGLWRDPDVLDTWFSSALWPFATLGWPEDAVDVSPSSSEEGLGVVPERAEASVTGATDSTTPNPSSSEEGLTRAQPGTELARHYPNDVLISGFDILFFWDARMMMQGMHFMGEVPWRTLYLHGLVRAADGQKMSKSKGNTVDPLGLIDRYGADALRFFMAAMESQGRDIKMDEKRLEGYRNFATKLWNAARFCQSNGIGASEQIEPPHAELPVNRWIISETIETVRKLDQAFADYRFDGAANAIYHFTWDRFCDWYLELIKPVLQGAESPPSSSEEGQGVVSERAKASVKAAKGSTTPNPSSEEEGDTAEEIRRVAGWVLDQILVMLHPFMPFVTEELWSKMGDRPDYPLITAKWPITDAGAVDAGAAKEIDWLINLVGEIRRARADLGIGAGMQILMSLSTASTGVGIGKWFRNRAAIEHLARVKFDDFRPLPEHLIEGDGWGELADEFLREIERGSMVVEVAGLQAFARLEGVIDLDAEKSRLAKSLESAEKESASLDKRLSNPQFLDKAKPEAIEKARADHAEKTAEAERLHAALARLG